jgi:hyperosmotically inducible periplasmic protein
MVAFNRSYHGCSGSLCVVNLNCHNYTPDSEEPIMSHYRRTNCWMFLAAVLAAGATRGQAQTEPKPGKDLIREVRHQLVLLPYYSVFDNLTYQVEGGKVTLNGQVVRPSLKSDAENVVKKIEGVSSVVNNIEVLPNSPNDSRLRRAIYRAIYNDTTLSRYGIQAVPPIHIIVKNGNVTLEGVVDSDGDKNMAGLRANGVSGVFSVTNNLTVPAKG